MNNKRRESLKTALQYLDRAFEIISAVEEEEQDALDNMPENLQYSERYERSEYSVDCLGDARSSVEDAKEKIEEASRR